MLRRLLALPELSRVDVDGHSRIDVHGTVLSRKPMLRNVFAECHQLFMELDRKHFGSTEGLRIELGAGVAPVKDTYPEVLATDIVTAPGLDLIIDSQDMDLDTSSVRAFYGQNCFHHFSDPDAFFRELTRVTKPGGGAILIEPFHGPVASVLFKHLFASEIFDKNQTTWKTPQSSGPMYGANQALSYIVFKRDAFELSQKYPSLEIVEQKPLDNYVRYLLSGGLNFRSLVPSWSEGALRGIEAVLRPAAGWLALHHVVVLRHRDN